MSTTPPPGSPTDQTGSDETRTAATPRAGARAFDDLRRSDDDRLVAGVCGGVARRLDVDPVLVRVLTVVLCFVGLAGVILYVAGWLLLPEDDEPSSLVARWFDLGASQTQVRDIGLVGAGVLAVVAIVGDGGWGWGGGAVWLVAVVGLPVAFVIWLARRSGRPSTAADAAAADPASGPIGTSTPSAGPGWPGGPEDTAVLERPAPTRVDDVPPPPPASRRPAQPKPPRRPREPYSWVPTLLGLSLTAIALAVLRLTADPAWPVYVALALAVLGAVLVLSTFTRGGGPLVVVGLALLPLLAVASVLPTLRTGEQVVRPTTTAEVRSTYTHGVGSFELDLGAVTDPEDLVGRTIRVDTGIGETRVWVPEGLPVVAKASVDAGDLEVLDTRRSGVGQEVGPTGGSFPDALTIVVDQGLGRVVVDAR